MATTTVARVKPIPENARLSDDLANTTTRLYGIRDTLDMLTDNLGWCPEFGGNSRRSFR